MKTIFKYAYVALFAVLALASCTDEYDYTPADKANQGGNATIEASASSYTFLPGETQTVTVTVHRIDSTKADTVHLTSNSEYFKASPVSFAAGEANKTITINGTVPVGKSETVTIAVADADAFLYGVKEVNFTVSVYQSYNGVITSSLFRNPFRCVIYDLTNGDFMIPSAYEDGYDITFHINFTTNIVTAMPQYAMVYSEAYGRLQFNTTNADGLIYGHYDPETLTVSLEDITFALPDINNGFSGTYTEYYTFEEDPNA